MIRFHPFHGLGSEHNAFVKSINSRPDEPTIEEVHSLLLSSDMRLQRLNSTDQIQFAQANLAAQGNRKSQKQIKTKNGFLPFGTFQLVHNNRPFDQSQPSSILGKASRAPNATKMAEVGWHKSIWR